MAAPSPLLENPPENPCFGCGPDHARGLRLGFARVTLPDGREAVECTHVPPADGIGWPGLMHTGLHFTALFETSYWAALTLTGKVHVAHGPVSYAHQRLPRVGQPMVARAWIAERDPLVVEAASEGQGGKPLGTLRSGWRPASRAQVAKAGIVLPAYLLDEMDP